MKLTIKEEYIGKIITKNTIIFSTIIFDTNKVLEKDYRYYYDAGFQFVFNSGEINKPILYKGIEKEIKKKRKKKYERKP